jgi:hypothetical protein
LIANAETMVRGFWTAMAAGLVLGVTGLPMGMNFSFGRGLGTSEGTGLMLGGLSVAFDGLKALLPLFVAWQWRDRHWMRAGAGGVLFALVAAYGMASALGFSSQNREGATAGREHLNANLKEHLADLEAAEKRLKALGEHRISGAVEADIAKLKKDRLWDATSGCTDATVSASREFCKRIETLRAELALAAEDNVLTAKAEELKFRIDQLRARGAGREADPQLGEIARATGADLLRALRDELAPRDRGGGRELLRTFRHRLAARGTREEARESRASWREAVASGGGRRGAVCTSSPSAPGARGRPSAGAQGEDGGPKETARAGGRDTRRR